MNVQSAPAENQCMERVGGTVTFHCSLPKGHDGPHYAIENRQSVLKRERWEGNQKHYDSPLAEFQGPAQTTAERYTDNPTPVPQSPAIMRADAEAARNQAEDDARYAAENEVETEARAGRATVRDAADAEDLRTTGRIGDMLAQQAGDRRRMRDRHDDIQSKSQEMDRGAADRAVEAKTDAQPFRHAPSVRPEGDRAPLSSPDDLRAAQRQVESDLAERQPAEGLGEVNPIADLYAAALDSALLLRRLLTMREAMRDDLTQTVEGELNAHPIRGTAARFLAERIVDKILDAAPGVSDE